MMNVSASSFREVPDEPLPVSLISPVACHQPAVRTSAMQRCIASLGLFHVMAWAASGRYSVPNEMELKFPCSQCIGEKLSSFLDQTLLQNHLKNSPACTSPKIGQ